MISISKNVVVFHLRNKGYFDVKVTGGCMVPLISNGDIVRVYPVESQLEVGDIVLVFSSDEYRLHRILYIDDKTVLTKGDNAKNVDDNKDVFNIIARYNGSNKHAKLIAAISNAEYRFRNKFSIVSRILEWVRHLLYQDPCITKNILRNIKGEKNERK